MKKKKKTDADTISKEDHELDYLQKKYGISRGDGRKIIDAVGHSRKAVMKYLRDNNLIKEPE